jgi:hypothetical protein
VNYYTFEGYPYLDEKGLNPHVPLATTHNERTWPGELDTMRRDGRLTIVDQTPENHPNPKAGRGWACAILADLSVYDGFVEVAADGPDGEIIHKIYGELHCPVGKGAVHDCAKLDRHLKKCDTEIESSEYVCDECDDELAVIEEAKLTGRLKRSVNLLTKEMVDHEKNLDRLHGLRERIVPEKTAADEKFAALKSELESKRGGS